ncbi:hypothetical protein OsI_07518 [Oryza sativa Indica Group]|uniref:Uncharacterized protein n=1 Tax=Oryza sativa subsp. indica TaxID=39946 RepID=B8AJ11_ORYSI|nr:hypothetical protein OsI_07518 [Oryza sativa Indica Group]
MRRGIFVFSTLKLRRSGTSHPLALSGAAASYWNGSKEDEDNTGEEDDDGDEDRSLDLLVRFLHSVFRKVSRRARRAARSMLPLSVPAERVKFSVNAAFLFSRFCGS